MWSKGCWMKSLPCRILCMLPLKKKGRVERSLPQCLHPVPRISHGAGWNLITFDCMVPLSFHSVLSPWLQIANKKPSIQRCLWIKWAVVVVVVRNEKSSNELQNEARPRGWWLTATSSQMVPPKSFQVEIFRDYTPSLSTRSQTQLANGEAGGFLPSEVEMALIDSNDFMEPLAASNKCYIRYWHLSYHMPNPKKWKKQHET